MRASTIEFRLRMAINAAIIVLGFWAPWIDPRGIGPRETLLAWLAGELSRPGMLNFSAGVLVIIAVSAVLAAMGAWLRIWGTAYLGTGTVNSLDMEAGRVVANGPYRYMRNPLYAGVWFMVAAMAFIMPITGALFAVVLISVFLLRLILAEEAFLLSQLGEPYKLYLRAVPRLVPRLRASLPAAGARPHWLRALVAELTPIGIFVTLAFLSWSRESYDSRLMGRTILIFFGASLIARGLMPSREPEIKPDLT